MMLGRRRKQKKCDKNEEDTEQNYHHGVIWRKKETNVIASLY
jgi:hypothetical protein